MSQFREFLTGFHKRKLQRKKHAQETLEKELKEERKRLKADAKESYKKLVISHRPIPELEELLADEYEDDEVKVKVVELSAFDGDNRIGPNKPIRDVSQDDEDDGDEEEEEEQAPGMELKRKPEKKASKAEAQEKVGEFKTERDVKKVLKKQATRNVKKSKVFQMKNKIESRKQKKKSMQLKKERIKVQNKKTKGRKGRGAAV